LEAWVKDVGSDSIRDEERDKILLGSEIPDLARVCMIFVLVGWVDAGEGGYGTKVGHRLKKMNPMENGPQ